jgi:hypothetical protein
LINYSNLTTKKQPQDIGSSVTHTHTQTINQTTVSHHAMAVTEFQEVRPLNLTINPSIHPSKQPKAKISQQTLAPPTLNPQH